VDSDDAFLGKGRPRSPGATTLAVPAGTRPVSDAYLDGILGIRELEAAHAIYVRRWLRIALTHPSTLAEGRNHRARNLPETLRLLRRAGGTAIEANVRSWFLKKLPELTGAELERDARRLARTTRSLIADELRLEDKAFLPARGGQRADGGDARDRVLKYVTLQVAGMLSVLGMQVPLRATLESAVNAAGKETYPHSVHGGSTDDGLTGNIGHPIFPRRVIDGADRVAGQFGLPYGNTFFRKSLMQAARLRGNDNLVSLGAAVFQDQAVRTIVQSILANPRAGDITSALRKDVDPDILIPVFAALGLGEAFRPSQEESAAGISPEDKVKAVQAVVAAAYVSYKCDGLVLARYLPDSIRGCLNAAAQVIGHTTQAKPLASRVKRPSPAPIGGRAAKRNPRTERSSLRQGAEKAADSSGGGLVLTRLPGEKIVLDDDIFIEVAQVMGSKVHIRIKAPEDVSIMRGEIWEQGARG